MALQAGVRDMSAFTVPSVQQKSLLTISITGASMFPFDKVISVFLEQTLPVNSYETSVQTAVVQTGIGHAAYSPALQHSS